MYGGHRSVYEHNKSMEKVDEHQLYTDLLYRYQYMCKFMNFDENDIKLIHGSQKPLGPRVPFIVDAVYEKLFAFSCTKRIFYRERMKHDLHMDIAKESLESYDDEKPQGGMRKLSLKLYITRLISKPYDGSMLVELDRMGKIHRNMIKVELIHVQVLMAYIQDIIVQELFKYKKHGTREALNFDVENTARAFCKLLAIQNQFISRYYEDPASQCGHGVKPSWCTVL